MLSSLKDADRHLDIVKYLVERGANVHGSSEDSLINAS